MSLDAFQTLIGMFLQAVEKHSKGDAFLSKAGGRYQAMSSHAALRQAAALARALERRGVEAGDRVALLAENSVEWALTDYAVLGMGAILVPIFPTLLETDVEFILGDSEAKGIIVSTDEQLRKVQSIRSRLPNLSLVLAMSASTGVAGAEGWGEVVEAEGASGVDPVPAFRRRALEATQDDTASIIYTSGTTGEPKGVTLSHANIASNVLACEGVFPLSKDDVAMSFLPLAHIFERMLDYYYFWHGVTIAYAESLEALPHNLLEIRPKVMGVVPRVLEKVYAKVMETVRQTPPTRQKFFHWAIGVGKQVFPMQIQGRTPPLKLRLQHALADKQVFSKVRERLGGRMEILISGAAPLARELAEFFFAVGLPVYEGYGLTETSPVISVNCPGHVKLGTVGRVIPGVEVKFLTEGGESEILVRGPNVTPGYYHLEEENQQAFVEGWFRTGDLGALAADGYLSITGRKKNLFKTSGGKYVSPEKLENLFQGHGYVAQIMVVGDGRKFVSALVVPHWPRLEALGRERGVSFRTPDDLATHPQIHLFMMQQVEEVNRQLAPHERIRQIALLAQEFTIQSGGLTPTHKIKRRVAEERFRDRIDAMYQSPPLLSAMP